MVVTVYAIAKDEEKFALRWYESMKEADHVVVLDTGSADRTAQLLLAAGATVSVKKIVPWRFDTARNESMKLIPEDTEICVCTDLDEVFEAGWREKLEKGWTAGTRRARYRYVWSHVGDNGERPGVEFFIEKAHARTGFRWKNAVHEVLTADDPCPAATIAGVTLHHYPDPQKSRAEYLPLLELAVNEDPDNDRNVHYLGREYMFRGRYDEAITTLTRHLAMPAATWADERAASMRYIARCYSAKGKPAEAERWLLRAVAEAPHLREPYMDYARLLYSREDWRGTAWVIGRALAITERPANYISEPDAWGPLPYDLLSIALYHLGDYDGAINAVDRAMQLYAGSDLRRLKANKSLYLSAKPRP